MQGTVRLACWAEHPSWPSSADLDQTMINLVRLKDEKLRPGASRRTGSEPTGQPVGGGGFRVQGRSAQEERGARSRTRAGRLQQLYGAAAAGAWRFQAFT